MRFVIIGNGVAGTSAARVVRQRDPKAAITMISSESDYFFSRCALMYAYMDRMSLRDLEPVERKVYDQQAIERIRDQVVDLDANRQTVTLRSGASLNYDRLLLATGSAPRRPDWEGLDRVRDGVVNFVSLGDLEECERLTPSTHEAVVVGGGLIGVELTECLAHHGKKVTFLVMEPWYWPAGLTKEEGTMISEHIRTHGVDVHLEEQASEVLRGPDGRVRAVRTASGREFACQMLGIAIGVRPAVGWLGKVATPPRLGRGIVVTPGFRTSLENVWAAGDCAEIETYGHRPLLEQIWYSARRQGELAGRSMLGDEVNYQPPIFYNSAKFFEIEYTTVGTVNNAPSDATEFYSRVPGKDVSVRLVEHKKALIGFNMLGSRWNHTVLERWIRERRSIEYVMARLSEAQFDVEFGRQDLSRALEEFRDQRAAVL